MFAHARTGACWLAAALGVLAWSPQVAARCAGPTTEIFPEPSDDLASLPTNGRIVVEIEGLMGVERKPPEVPMELRSPKDRVALKAVETNVAAVRGAVQMVFVPERELRPHTSYVLYLLEDGRPFQGAHGETFAWTTAAGADRDGPRWRTAPRVKRGSSRMLGCGDEVYVPVSVSFDDGTQDTVRILAEVKPIGGAAIPTGGAATARYLLRPRRNEIRIGHEMCGGPFDLLPGRRYTVKLTAVDAAGNETPAPGGLLEIVGPVDRDALGQR